MTTRTLLITIPGDILDDRNACGDCPFAAFDWAAGALTPGRMVCTMPGWEETDIGTGRRHAACLDAERDATGVSERKQMIEAQAFRAEINRSADRYRLREVHENLTAHGLPALERMDKESEAKGDSGECVCGHDLLAHDGHAPNRCLGSSVMECHCDAFEDAMWKKPPT